MKVTKLIFNWFQTGDNESGHGEDWDVFEVGKMSGYCGEKFIVTKIEEHRAAGEGDKWFYDVFFDNGKFHRIFNPNRAIYEPDNSL